MAFTVTYTITGGTPNYTVNLTGSGVPANVHASDGTYSFINVPAGSWDIDAIDSIGCILPSIPVVLVASTTTTVAPSTCLLVSFDMATVGSEKYLNNGSITVSNVQTIVGNITYSINSGQTYQLSNVFNNLAPGNYTIVVKDDIEAGCEVTGYTQVSLIPAAVPYAMTLENISPGINGGSGNNGTSGSPYDSGVIIEFDVEGNGGTGFVNPTTYSLAVRQLTYPFDMNIGVSYIDQGNAFNGDPIFLTSPRGSVTTNSEAHSFSGGFDCIDNVTNSVQFFNVSGLDTAFVEILLYKSGILVDTFGLYISASFGAPPPPC